MLHPKNFFIYVKYFCSTPFHLNFTLVEHSFSGRLVYSRDCTTYTYHNEQII